MNRNKIWKEKNFRDILFLCAIGAALLFACYFVFFNNEDKSAEKTSAVSDVMTAEESKLCAVLSEIEGVGKINAYINVAEAGEATGVILIFEGADSLSVRMDVLDATALALGVDKKNILIYKLTKE